MVRAWSIALGIGLILLWIFGLASPATPWLTWLDGVAALISFGVAGAVYPSAPSSARSGGPLTLSACLVALWIIGLATAATPWLAWWTFAFACAYFLVGISGSRPVIVSKTPPNYPPRSDDELERAKREQDEDRRRSA